MDTAPLEKTVNRFFAAWCSRDATALQALWDTDDRSCSYLPAKAEQRLIGADAVMAYITARTGGFETIRLRPRKLYLRRMTDQLGSVFAEVDWALKKHAESRPIGGTLRVSGVLRDVNGHWRFCHYAESPLAPLVELRRFYQAIAADGHEGFR